MCIDILDLPSTRSTNRMGTSITCPPCRRTWSSISIWKPYPSARTASRSMRRQGLGPIGPEPRGRVGDVQAQQQRGVDVATLGQQAPVPAPVRDRSSRDVARPHHEIDAFEKRGDQARERLGLMGEVGVHLDEGLPAPIEAPCEAGPVGTAQAGLGGAPQDVDVAELVAQLLGQIGGAVGAAVVDHQHAARRAWPPGCAAGRGRCSLLRCTSAGRPGRARRQPRGPSWGRRCPPRPQLRLGHWASGALDRHSSRTITWIDPAMGMASSVPTNPPKNPPTRSPTLAPTKMAMSTRSGLIRTVRLMTMGFRMWFSIWV